MGFLTTSCVVVTTPFYVVFLLIIIFLTRLLEVELITGTGSSAGLVGSD